MPVLFHFKHSMAGVVLFHPEIIDTQFVGIWIDPIPIMNAPGVHLNFLMRILPKTGMGFVRIIPGGAWAKRLHLLDNGLQKIFFLTVKLAN